MPARTERWLLLAAACLPACAALAQAPQWPSPDDMARALRAHPFPEARQLDAQPPRNLPRIEGRPGTLDLEALARGGAITSTPAPPSADSPAVRIFITLEMPRASLQRLVDQAARSGATLVLRGLKAQSLRETLAVAGNLIDNRPVAWVIDPQAFARYSVRLAPTFVLALSDTPSASSADAGSAAQSPCGSGCITPVAFVSVAGDVSLDYALEAMVRSRPEAAPRAAPILARLKGS